MDIAKIVAQLRQELANIDAAINSLERLEQGRAAKAQSPPAEGDSGEAADQPRAAGKPKAAARGARS
jgi:hypothetical protein